MIASSGFAQSPSGLTWLLSLIVALTVHGIIVLSISLMPSDRPPPGAQAKGAGGLKIGYVGGGGRRHSAIVSAVQQRPSPITPVVNKAVKAAVLKPAVIKPVLKKPVVKKAVVKKAKVKKVVVKKIVVKNPAIKKRVKPISKKKPSPVQPSKSAPTKSVTPAKKKSQNTMMATTADTPADSQLDQAGEGEGVGLGTSGMGRSDQGGGKPGLISDYQTAIRAWLEQHKRYPKRALRRRQQGVATLYFEIDRRGYVITHTIRTSSGHSILDRAVHAMLRRASPLPVVPAGIAEQSLEFTVPIDFSIHSK